MIPISKPDLGESEEAAVLEVMRSGMLAMGRRTVEFEERWAAYCGTRYAVMMSSGTVALEALLTSLGIGPGDEVITVSFTFNATVSAILRVGATPVFVDVRESDFCMDPARVEEAITRHTMAIMPVHLYGLMADMNAIEAIAQRQGLQVIEDAAQAHGAAMGGRKAGSFGHAMFSLYATKNLTSGEGGVVTTDSAVLCDRLRLLRNHGMRERYRHEALGTNLKPTDIAAAIAIAQLKRLDQRNGIRAENAARLTSLLPGYLTPVAPPGRTHVWHQYTMRFPVHRDSIAERLHSLGVGSLAYYPVPIHRQPYHEWGAAHLPVTDMLAGEVLSVPVHPLLTDADLTYIAGSIRRVADPVL